VIFAKSVALANSVLMLHSQLPLSLPEIARSAGLGYEAASSAVRTLEKRRLVIRGLRMGKDVFEPDRSDPHYPMAYGAALVDLPLGPALSGERVYAVYAYGSLSCPGGGSARSDLDLFVLADLRDRLGFIERLSLVGERYGRAIDPFILDPDKLEMARASEDPHVVSALAGVRIMGQA
jgi:hypothetical protein